MADQTSFGDSAVRRPRADARRNRDRLVAAARSAFVEQGPDVSLEEIARRAGVGIGTLYRHFPARDAILAAVYRHEVGQLAKAGSDLLDSPSPLEGLRAWMLLFVEYVATKKVVAPALIAIIGESPELFASTGGDVKAALYGLVDRAVAADVIRLDVDPIDLLYALFGFANVNNGPGWEASARRLVDVLIDGLKRTPTDG